jgi:activating signal cointegrator complex subunit 1
MSRPTHFLSLPLGHHLELRNKVATVQKALRKARPSGFHDSILISPRRLHLSFGVLGLEGSKQSSQENRPTVSKALQALQECQPRIGEVMKGRSLSVNLQGLASFSSDLTECHVLYALPKPDDVLTAVCDVIFDSFKSQGLLASDRPYTLHLTIVNTSHRKTEQKRRGKRIPRLGFDATSLFALPAADLDFGTYSIDKISLCRMGSHNEEGDYISEGDIFFDNSNATAVPSEASSSVEPS